jgi:hypothetical protein
MGIRRTAQTAKRIGEGPDSNSGPCHVQGASWPSGLDHTAKRGLRNAKRPGSRLSRSGRQHFVSVARTWRAMWSGWARKSSRKRSGKSFQRTAASSGFKGLRRLSVEASPLCPQVSVWRKPRARLWSGARARGSRGLRHTKDHLRQPNRLLRGFGARISHLRQGPFRCRRPVSVDAEQEVLNPWESGTLGCPCK